MAGVPILYDLDLKDKMYLAHMTQHPGFEVLQRMMTSACDQVNAAVIKLDPEDANYERIVAVRQQSARVINHFCAELLKSIEFHKRAGVVQEQEKQLADFNLQKVTQSRTII